MRTRNAIAAIALAVLCGGVQQAAPAAERDLPPDARAAIQSGVAWLVAAQNPDGSWLSDGRTGTYPVAMTALAGLALCAEGNTPYSGTHAENVRRAVEYLLLHADPQSGLIGGYEGGRPMFGHGFSMLFLAQVYGSEGQAALRERIRGVLVRAVGLTAGSQSALGGWFYTPGSDQDEGAVTVTQLQGLRACADAGIPVPAETIERALGYIRKSANPDGGIAYKAGTPGDSRPGVTCAALASLYASGLYEDPLVGPALAFARANVTTRPASASGGLHFFYSHLYLAPVMFFRGGPEWTAYFGGLRAFLVGAQRPDGSWQGDFAGTAYGTSVALIILQLPDNALPVFQR